MIKRVLVLGGGSAGFLAAITLKTRLPDLEVRVLRSSELGVIGVGEGTTFSFPLYIHGQLGIDPGDFFRMAQPSWKLGIRFLKWGPRDHFDYTFRPQVTNRWEGLPKFNGYYCEEDFDYCDISPALMSENKVFLRNPQGQLMLTTDVGYHIENRQFVEFLEKYAATRGVEIVDDLVLDVKQNDHGVAGLVLKSGGTETADLYVDCSGFVSLLLSKTLKEPFVSFGSTLFCDRAVVGGWDRTTEPIKPYTASECMKAGWCWQIEHEHRINRGYVYSSAFISDTDAEAEFRAANPKVQSTRLVKFTTGRNERAWVRNVVGIGNACGFVEPLEATALGAICDEAHALAISLIECDRQPGPQVQHHYNIRSGAKWDNIRQFLAVHYKFNTRYDTPFWKECREKCDLGPAEQIVAYYQENGPGNVHSATLLNRFDIFGLEGYWSLLIGQKVPYRRTHTITEEERAKWKQIQAMFRTKASTAGVDIPQALSVINAPGFKWPEGMFRSRSAMVTF